MVRWDKPRGQSQQTSLSCGTSFSRCAPLSRPLMKHKSVCVCVCVGPYVCVCRWVACLHSTDSIGETCSIFSHVLQCSVWAFMFDIFSLLCGTRSEITCPQTSGKHNWFAHTFSHTSLWTLKTWEDFTLSSKGDVYVYHIGLSLKWHALCHSVYFFLHAFAIEFCGLFQSIPVQSS